MESKNNEDPKMSLYNAPQSHELYIPIQMEEEEEKINTSNTQIKQEEKQNQNTTSADLNASAITNYSSNSKNSKKSEESKIIEPPIKPNTDYLYNLEYFDEMYENFLLDEKNYKLKINPKYMEEVQNNINEEMRAILVDWLIEIHNRFPFRRKTLFQTIYILDLYLSKKAIQRNNFQLLGIACLLIASKVNEIYYPKLEKFVDSTDGAYTIQELLNMEIDVMQTLNFDIFSPTPEDFYDVISKTFEFTRKQHLLGSYLLDSSLIIYSLLKFQPSVIAVSCAYIVMKFFGINGYKGLYSSTFTKISTKKERENIIKNCAREICFFIKKLSSSNTLKSTKEKYSLNEFGNVAELMDAKKTK